MSATDCILTKRLRLRLPAPDDADALARLMTPDVSRWLATWPSPMTSSDMLARMAKAERRRAAGTALDFVIELLATAWPIGWIGMSRRPDDPRRAMLGYWLGPAVHGRGYATESAAAFVAYAVANWHIDVVEAGGQVANRASLRVLEKIGMKFTDERMIYAPVRDRSELCAFYELRREP